MLKKFDLSSSALHLLAMAFMLMDHVWATLLPMQPWLTCLGRIAFPIFGFLAVEGYFHTHDFKKYMQRLLIFALISEIPFDLMYSSLPFYPYHQNVLWTLMLALGGIRLIERTKQKQKFWLTVLVSVPVVAVTALLAQIAGTDIFAAGVLTVYVFYFFRGRKWWCFLGQFLLLYWLNVEVLAGLCYIVTIGGKQFELVQQGFALLALPFLWLYRGRKGIRSRKFQYFCYAFYPLHALLLALLMLVRQGF